MKIPFPEAKVTTVVYSAINSTTEKDLLSRFLFSPLKILATESKVRTILYSIVNRGTVQSTTQYLSFESLYFVVSEVLN